MKETGQRSASLKPDARQRRLVTEADVPKDTKTRQRMEDVAAERVISEDNSSAQIDPDPICLTSSGNDSTGPTALVCSRDDALVNNGAVAPRPCISPARCAREQPRVAYSPLVQPLQR